MKIDHRDCYFKLPDGFIGIHEAEGYGVWMNVYDTDWKFAASVARLSDFDLAREEYLKDGYVEVKKGDE